MVGAPKSGAAFAEKVKVPVAKYIIIAKIIFFLNGLI
jgi:hypothetical protein